MEKAGALLANLWEYIYPLKRVILFWNWSMVGHDKVYKVKLNYVIKKKDKETGNFFLLTLTKRANKRT